MMSGGKEPAEFFEVVPCTDAAEQKAKVSLKKADKQASRKLDRRSISRKGELYTVFHVLVYLLSLLSF